MLFRVYYLSLSEIIVNSIQVLFLNHSGAIEIPYHVIHTSEGNVDSGNYTFYTLKQPGTLRLVLTPLAGDPDLYVSEGTI